MVSAYTMNCGRDDQGERRRVKKRALRLYDSIIIEAFPKLQFLEKQPLKTACFESVGEKLQSHFQN